jgi:hypothetical protein
MQASLSLRSSGVQGVRGVKEGKRAGRLAWLGRWTRQAGTRGALPRLRGRGGQGNIVTLT